jgi:hypothetical protein
MKKNLERRNNEKKNSRNTENEITKIEENREERYLALRDEKRCFERWRS